MLSAPFYETFLTLRRTERDINIKVQTSACKERGKGKAVPLQASTGPQSSRRLRLPEFKKIGA